MAVSFLSGDLTQRQIGVGYAALTDLMGGYGAASPPGPAGLGEPVPEPQLTLAETDAALGQIGVLAGQGSQAERRRLLAGLLGRATEAERQFLVRLLAGDLRQGALDGVMTDAIARAAGVPGAEVRRAHQLSGSLAAAAAAALRAGGDAENGEPRRCGRSHSRWDARSGLCSPRPRRPWRPHWTGSRQPRSSGRWMASGSRCTARAPMCGSSPGRWTTSLTGCPR